MLDHAMEAVQMAQGRDRTDLNSDRKLNLALVRLLEIIGEAAAKVSDTTRDRIPDVPWHEIVSLRNRLIHGYDQVDFDILWQIIQYDLPRLIAQLERILSLGDKDKRQ
jgi:uncharacterized protein with HEPN domain